MFKVDNASLLSTFLISKNRFTASMNDGNVFADVTLLGKMDENFYASHVYEEDGEKIEATFEFNPNEMYSMTDIKPALHDNGKEFLPLGLRVTAPIEIEGETLIAVTKADAYGHARPQNLKSLISDYNELRTPV